MPWDVFLAIGTFLFALNMWTHPRFGRAFTRSPGGVLAVLLLTLNFGTFPEPPAGQARGRRTTRRSLVPGRSDRISFSLRWVDRNATASNPQVG